MVDYTILAISHSNYLINCAGTEKFMRDLSKNLKFHNVYYLQIFPYKINGKVLYGVNYKNQFKGIFSLLHLVNYFKKNNINLIGVHIHHLLGFNVEEIGNFLYNLNLPIYYFIHDYYSICSSINMINSSGDYCGISFPMKEKCMNCTYFNGANAIKTQFKEFFNLIDSLLKVIIVPSVFVYQKWMLNFPLHEKRIIVRNHLVINSYINDNLYTNGKKLKIAYCGAQNSIKGYNQWYSLIQSKNETFEYYYFGLDRKKDKNVTNIYVNVADKNSVSMTEALKNNNIDIVFLWSNWPETYCYVYYEAYAANCFIISNKFSGNVNYEVNKNGYGLIFNNFDSFLEKYTNGEFLIEYKNIKNTKHTFPEYLLVNENVDNLFSVKKFPIIEFSKKRITKYGNFKALSFYYYFRHRLFKY